MNYTWCTLFPAYDVYDNVKLKQHVIFVYIKVTKIQSLFTYLKHINGVILNVSSDSRVYYFIYKIIHRHLHTAITVFLSQRCKTICVPKQSCCNMKEFLKRFTDVF